MDKLALTQLHCLGRGKAVVRLEATLQVAPNRGRALPLCQVK